MAIVGAAFAAGLLAILVTVAVERFGGRLGGVLGTVPTTIVPASVGMYLGSSPEAFDSAMWATPAGMFLNALFLYVWRVLPPHLPRVRVPLQLGLMVLASLLVWLFGALLFVLFVAPLDGASVRLCGGTFAVLLAGMGLFACAKGVPAPKGKNEVGVGALASRGALAAVAVGASVWMADAVGGVAAGVASVFPAIFLTTMLALWWSQGRSVQAGAVGPMMLGSSSISVFAIVASWLMPAWGAWAAPVVWVCAVLFGSVPAAMWLRRGRDAGEVQAG